MPLTVRYLGYLDSYSCNASLKTVKIDLQCTEVTFPSLQANTDILEILKAIEI